MPLRHTFLIATLPVIGARNAFAGDESNPSVRAAKQQTEELEHAIIVGVGGATEMELGDGSFHLGVNAFVEYEAIEYWLKLELGVSMLPAEGGCEVPIDLLVKKPFRLTRHLELMIGIGPEIVIVSGTEKNGTFIGASSFLTSCFGRRATSDYGLNRITRSQD